MIIKKTILLLLLSVFFVVCNKEQNEVIIPRAHTVDKAEMLLLEASNEFGYKTFSNLTLKQAENRNLLISPINAALAFNVLIQASNNTTKNQIKQFLRINHLKDTSIIKGFDELNRLFSEIDERTKLEGINKLAVFNRTELEDKLKKFIENRKYLEIADNNTGITNSENSFHLINSINFEAEIKFQKGTNDLPFYNTPDEISFVKMIVAESEFNLYSDPAIQAVELPMGRGNFNLLMIIPQGSQELNDLAAKLDERLIKRIKSKFKARPLEVYLPLLSISGVETFKNILIKSKMSNCFNQRKADFSRLSASTKFFLSDFEQFTDFNLKTSDFLHSRPDLTEKTSLLIDRPFLFVVYEKYSEAVILIGKISHL